MNSSLPSWFVFVFPLYFAFVWCGVLFGLSRFGWNRMARYTTSGRGSGRRWNFQAASIAGIQYNGALEVAVGSEGVYLRVFPLFSLFHSPLLLPYSALSAPVEVKRWGRTLREYRVSLEDKADGKSVKIVFYNDGIVNAIESERRNSPFSS